MGKDYLLQRKDASAEWRYPAGCMGRRHYSPDTGVADLLARVPTASAVFNSHKTGCCGCYLARFCTVRDATSTYGLALEPFLDEIKQFAISDPSFLIGAQDAEIP